MQKSGVVLLMLLLGSMGRGASEVTDTWLGGNGDWALQMWSYGQVPNNNTSIHYNVQIDGGKAGVSSVSFGGIYAVDSLRVSSGDSLWLRSGTLTTGSVDNSGTISESSTSLVFSGSGTLLTGSGTLIVSAGTLTASSTWANGGNYILANAISNISGNGGTLFSIPSITGTKMTNSGVICGNGPTSLSILTFAGGITNTATGYIDTNGGTIELYAPLTMSRDDELHWSKGGDLAFYSGLTTSGRNVTVPSGGSLYADLTNNGGTVTFNGSGNGSVVSNVGGRLISTKRLQLMGTINNGGGTISAVGGVVQLYNGSNFSGGTFESSGGGYLEAFDSTYGGNTTLGNFTNNGTVDLEGNAYLTGTIDGSGTLNFTHASEYFSVGTVTLGGTGTAVLAGCSAEAASSVSSGSATLINDVYHAISGYGSLCSNSGGTVTKTLINRGLIQAAGSGTGTALLTGSNHFINTATGTLRAVSGNTLSIGSPDFTNAGTIDIQSGGTLDLHSASGGTASLGNVLNAGTVLLTQTSASVDAINGGTLIVNDSGGVSVDQMNVNYFSATGTVTLVAGASKAAIKTKAFSETTVNMNDRGALIDYDTASPLTSLTNQIKAGYNSAGGRWAAATGAIYSTAAAADPDHRGIGIAEISTLFGSSIPTTFLGQSVDSTTVALRYTYSGDANLDGKVDISDLGILAGHWQQSGGWAAGDFNYDGRVDISDLGLLAGNWQAGVGGSPMSFAQAMAQLDFAGAAAPEPSLAASAALLLLRRRQRPAYCCS